MSMVTTRLGCYEFDSPGQPSGAPEIIRYAGGLIEEAAILAEEGQRKLTEAGLVDEGIGRLAAAHALTASYEPGPEVQLTFAHHAVITLTHYAVTGLANGVQPREIGVTADALQPHFSTAERSLGSLMGCNGNIDRKIIEVSAAAVATAGLLPGGSGVYGQWLRHSNRAVANVLPTAANPRTIAATLRSRPQQTSERPTPRQAIAAAIVGLLARPTDELDAFLPKQLVQRAGSHLS